MAALEDQLGLFVDAFDEHFDDLAFPCLVFRPGDLLLGFEEFSLSAVFDPRGDGIAERKGRGSFFERVGEDTHMIELGFLDEGSQFLEGLFGFAGKADDEIRPDGDLRADGTKLRQQFQEARAGTTPGHLLQHLGVRVLQWHIEILGAGRRFRDGAHEPLGEPIGIGVVDAEPAQAGHFAQGADQVLQGIGIAKIAAVVGGVLGHEADFQDALGYEIPGFGHNAFDAPAALATPQFRDDAEGAGVVAALADLEVGGGFGRGEQAWAVLIVEVVRILLGHEDLVPGADNFSDLLDVPGAQASINFGDVGQEFIAITLHQATRHDELLAGAGFLHGGGFKDGLNAFLLRGVNESAGVHHQDVGLLQLIRDGVALEPQVPQHDLAIHEVLGTAQGHEAHGGG